MLTAGRLGTPLLKQMCAGQAFTSPFHRWLRRILRTSGHMTELVRKTLVDMWGGLLNSKLVEDLNKQIREREQRTSTNKVAARMEAWQTPTHHRLLAGYKREEGCENPALQAPTCFEFSRLFEHTEAAKIPERETELSMLQGILGPQKWPSFTPASMQTLFIDLHLMMHASAEGNWDMVEDAWHSSLVAEGVVLHGGADSYFVLKQYSRGLVVWPVVINDDCIMELDLKVEELKIIHIFDLETWAVMVPKPASPMRLRSEGAQASAGFVLRVSPKPLTIQQHLMQTGFANISEDAMKKLYVEWDIDEPTMTEAAKEDVSLALSMGMLCNLDKKISEDEAVKRVLKYRFDDENWSTCPKVDLEFMRDTILEGDREKISKVLEKDEVKITKRQAARQKFATAARTLYNERRTTSTSGTAKASATTRKPTEKQVQAATAKIKAQGVRVYAALSSDSDATLKKELPPGVSVWTDEKNGRWKVRYADLPDCRRSISWTHVGGELAGLICLKQAWDWAECYAGAKTLAHLAAAFAEHGV